MTIAEKKHWVMDYETMINFFCGVFTHYKTEETKTFVIHDLQNDFEEFMEFLHENKNNKERHISFNGLAFDAQITEYCFQNEKEWKKLSGARLAHEIYKKAQLVIDKSSNREWLDFYEAKMNIPQIDLFKLNHWDNPAKRSSLKWIQFSMNWHNLQDMPIHHSTPINTQEEIDDVVGYCINDVDSTKAILHLSSGQINLRNSLTQEYDINLFSASEPRISKELFLHFLADKTGQKKNDIKYARTNRTQILGKNIILPYTKFTRPEFQALYDNFYNAKIDPLKTKGSLSYSISTDGVKIDFGLGGVHGAKESGVYEATEGMTIMTSDVVSYYPNLAIRNKWSPAHLDKSVFTEQYEWFFNERKKIPKSDPRNYVYKIILNSTYGLSNDKFCYLYDPQFTMQITINGQLSLMMLYEMIMERIPGAVPLMQNTDGLETMIPTEHIEEYMKICKEWEDLTQLKLEHDEYQKLILADVNNYIAINKFEEVEKEEYDKILKKIPHALVKKENDKYYYAPTKCKGRFEFDNLALHKNKSHLVVSKALFHFFVHNTPPETYLASNRNIFDYCIGKKIKGNWKFVEKYIKEGDYNEEDVQPTIRYYISKNGSKIYKINKDDGRAIKVESGHWLLNLFNKYEEKAWEEYGINEQYYQQMIYREIENIAGSRIKQLTLF